MDMPFKNEIQMENLINEINKLNSEIKNCNDEINKLKQGLKNSNEILDSNYNLFNLLLIDYELNPKGILKNMQILCQELLDFIVNVCNKHDLDWWLIGGNLIGAYRHGGYIPWDDDMDIGMMRNDFDKFNDVAHDEIVNHDLDEYLTLKVYPFTGKNFILPFTKLDCITKNNEIIAGVDIFPYDYAEDNDFTLDEFLEFRIEYYTRLVTGDVEELMKDYYSKFNLNLDDGKYIIPNPTFLRYAERYQKDLIFYDKNRITPFDKIVFNGKYYNCPNDIDYFLKLEYGDYMKIPKILVDQHNNVDNLRGIENIDVVYEEFISRLRECNENF